MIEISQVKEAIAKHWLVEIEGNPDLEGAQFYPTGYLLELNKDETAWEHKLILHDLKANSTYQALMKNITRIEGKVFKNGKVQEVRE